MSMELVRLSQSMRTETSALLSGGGPRPGAPPVTGGAYFNAGRLGVERSGRKNLEKTQSGYARHGVWFKSYLARCPKELLRSVTTAIPFDILSYMEGDYIVNHGNTKLPTGATVPAVNTVKGVLSALKQLFDHHGRTGPWSDETMNGNPRSSPLVTDWFAAYNRDMLKWGFEACAAYPLTDEKRIQLIDYIDGLRANCDASDTKADLEFQRDALLYCFLWDSVMRGAEGARLLFGDVHEDTPFGTVVRPTLLKNRKRLSCGTIKLVQGGAYAFTSRLPDWRATLVSRGAGICPKSPVFPAVGRTRALQVLDEPLGGPAVYTRFVAHLKGAGLYSGESVHSFRRGSVQARAAGGASEAQLMDAMLIATPAVVRVYSDGFRPTRGWAAPPAI
jgi:hypothetical protein